MPALRCPRVQFFSAGDEAAFFHWAEGIPGVSRVIGERDTIVLTVRSRLSASALRELLALFYRYKVPMRQLAAFATDANSIWFAAQDAYWHKSVFSNGA